MAIDHAQVAMIEAELRTLGEPPWRAKLMANRLCRGFAADATFVIKAFLRAGWLLDDIYMLDQISREWRKAPQQVLLLEKMLLAFGLWDNHARRLAMEPALYACRDFGEIGEKIHLFRSLGFSDKGVLDIGLRKPAILLMPAAQIKAWHTKAVAENKDPRFVVKRLKPLQGNKSPEPLPIPESWKQVDAYPEVAVPASPASDFREESITGFAILAPVRGELHRLLPEPSVEMPMPETFEPAPKDGDKTQDDDAAVHLEPSAQTAPPEVEPQQADAQDPPDENEGHQPTVGLSAETEDSGVSEAASEPKASPDTFDLSFADEAIDPDSLMDEPDDDDADDPEPARTIAERDADDDDNVGWLGLAKKILGDALPDWSDDDWRLYCKAHPWVLLSDCPEIRAMRLLAAWFDVSRLRKPGDPKSIFLASFMLGRNLPQEPEVRKRRLKLAVLKRKLPQAKGSVAYEIRQEIQHLEKLNATTDKQAPALYRFLELPAEVIYLRLYTLRSIIQHRTVQKHPEALLLPFESVQPDVGQVSRRLSIPPPNGSDMAVLQAKSQELRFRANQVESYGQNPWRKPFINMLLEPTRAGFLRRLERYMAKVKQGEDFRLSLGASRSRKSFFSSN